jgi:Xaa-Pro aminopeptidase
MTVTTFHLKIKDSEFQQRCDTLCATLKAHNLDGVVLFNTDYVQYYCGFAFIPTERPIAFVMSQQGEKGMFIPRMEVEHAKANALIDRVDYYNEYPDNPHPMNVLQKMLHEMGIKGRLGADNDGAPQILGYRGAKLSALGFEVVDVINVVEDQMMLKSAAEIDLLRESTRWATLALSLLKMYTKVGKTETEVVQRANAEATDAMLHAIGTIYKAQSWMNHGASAGYRGQIGRNSSIPHALAANITFQPGDVLGSGASSWVWGYQTELERTFIIGTPTEEQTRLFNHMVNLQDVAMETMKPGVKCSDVDKAVHAYFDKHNLNSYWRHHTGHAIGMRYHEGPFLDVGDDTVIQEGMCFTVEPGLYAAELGGFRHSETVVVHADGVEILTYYPRDLHNNLIEV